MTHAGTLASLSSGQSSIYPIPPVSRQALAISISDPATLSDAEEIIRVALAMQYALKAGAFAPRIIRVLRVNVLGMSQDALATRLSYSQVAVSLWETGKSECPADAYVTLVDLVRERLDRNIELAREGHALRQRVEHIEQKTEDE